MTPARVFITGVGPVTAVGTGREAFADALRKGRCGLAPAARSTDKLTVEIPQFDVEDYLESAKAYLDPAAELAFAAMSLAVEDADLAPGDLAAAGAGLMTGSAFGDLDTLALFFADCRTKGPRFAKPFLFPHAYPNTAISLLAIDYSLKGPHYHFSSGRISSAAALLEGFDRIRSGALHLAVVGGFEALNRCVSTICRSRERVCDETDPSGCAPFDPSSRGCVPGPGAGFLVLESASHAAARGAPPLAEILAGEFASVPPDATDHPAQSTLCALACALPRGPGLVVADANGVPERDRAECRAIGAAMEDRCTELRLTSIKAATGETSGAGGALQAIAASAMLSGRFAAPVANLKRAAGDLDLPCAIAQHGNFEPAWAVTTSADPGGAAVSLLLGCAT